MKRLLLLAALGLASVPAAAGKDLLLAIRPGYGSGVLCRVTYAGEYERGERYQKMRCEKFRRLVEYVGNRYPETLARVCWAMDECSHPRLCANSEDCIRRRRD